MHAFENRDEIPESISLKNNGGRDRVENKDLLKKGI